MPGLLMCLLVGFIAQMIDGALGMAYGVSCTTFLLSFGLAPAAACASVKMSEVFTTAVSGAWHWRLGNVDRRLFLRLCVPGTLGGVLGAYCLSNLAAQKIKPLVAGYLLLMGGMILARALRPRVEPGLLRDRAMLVGFLGGLLDAMGGGGWGPIVTTSLIARGKEPRLAIGSVNLAEFFVTVAQAATFAWLLGLQHRTVILGLIIGGVIAAPLAAYLCKLIPARTLMILVGAVIVALSLRNLVAAL
jgi:uncharacterized membrane protein YfcA